MSSLGPAVQLAVPVTTPAHPVGVFGVQRSRNGVLTLMTLPIVSNATFRSPTLPSHASDWSQATNSSLKVEQAYSGHSLEWKSKSNERPATFLGTWIWSVTPMVSNTMGDTAHAALPL